MKQLRISFVLVVLQIHSYIHCGTNQAAPANVHRAYVSRNPHTLGNYLQHLHGLKTSWPGVYHKLCKVNNVLVHCSVEYNRTRYTTQNIAKAYDKIPIARNEQEPQIDTDYDINRVNMALRIIKSRDKTLNGPVNQHPQDTLGLHIPGDNHQHTTPKPDVDPTPNKAITLLNKFMISFEKFDRKLYEITFQKLSATSPPGRQENGISFVQSGLFIYLLLAGIGSAVDPLTMKQIDDTLNLALTYEEKIETIKQVMLRLPTSDGNLKFTWCTRLIGTRNVSHQFSPEAVSALRLHLDRLQGNETTEILIERLNKMVENDSGGALRDTFEESDFVNGYREILTSVVHLRARWRTSPTLLNDTYQLRDADVTPRRTMRMIRINDNMRYALLDDWAAEAVELPYAKSGLSLLIMSPRETSLRSLASHVASTNLYTVTARMRQTRVALTLPLFTLRMTLLLPSKLQDMGITRLLDVNDTVPDENLRISLAVQRSMFWSESGRNAFKDDGIEWEEKPDLKILLDRPYIFFVRWRNMTLMSGNFVL